MIWVLLAALAAMVGAGLRHVTVDEAWSLVVARRLRRGERLYRDVFYGAGPLAIWIQAGVFRVLRPQGLVVRSLTVIYFAGQVAGAVALVGADGAMAVSGAMVALSAIHVSPMNHYGQLTSLATLWAAVAILEGLPLPAGLLMGAAILGRYTTGLVGSVALAAATVFLGSPTDAVVVAVAAALPSVVLAAVRRDAARWFVRRAVLNKPGYLETGAMHPLAWLRTRRWRRWRHVAVDWPGTVAIVVVIAAPIAAVWSTVTNGSDEALIAVVLACCAVSIAMPRFDGPHAASAAVVAVPSIALLVDPDAWSIWIGGAAWALAVGSIAGRWAFTSHLEVRRDVPALRWLPVTPLSGRGWPDQTDDLPSEVFVLRLDAAMVYAAGGVTNPTPFDYPAASTFGRTGQPDVIAAFRRGMPVCHGWTNTESPLAPRELLEQLPSSGGTPCHLGRLLTADV